MTMTHKEISNNFKARLFGVVRTRILIVVVVVVVVVSGPTNGGFSLVLTAEVPDEETPRKLELEIS